ncbi:MAG: hypothetical protein WAU64_01255 [Methanoregula sp.]|jgi:hypothetical protein|uniref:hypothetical protein n=1 Tax=Methanoregula sp. TaxID=2052170 RepID=UPI003BAFD14F
MKDSAVEDFKIPGCRIDIFKKILSSWAGLFRKSMNRAERFGIGGKDEKWGQPPQKIRP